MHRFVRVEQRQVLPVVHICRQDRQVVFVIDYDHHRARQNTEHLYISGPDSDV